MGDRLPRGLVNAALDVGVHVNFAVENLWRSRRTGRSILGRGLGTRRSRHHGHNSGPAGRRGGAADQAAHARKHESGGGSLPRSARTTVILSAPIPGRSPLMKTLRELDELVSGQVSRGVLELQR